MVLRDERRSLPAAWSSPPTLVATLNRVSASRLARGVYKSGSMLDGIPPRVKLLSMIPSAYAMTVFKRKKMTGRAAADPRVYLLRMCGIFVPDERV